MKRFVIILVSLLILSFPACGKTKNETTIYDMTVNYLTEPPGVDTEN